MGAICKAIEHSWGDLVIFYLLKKLPLILAGFLTMFVMSSCTMLGLNYASLEVENKPVAEPAIDVTSLADWDAGRAVLKTAFEDTLYGPWPTGLAVSFGQTRRIEDAFGALGYLEETPITLGEGDGARTFHLAVAYPALAATSPVPLVVAQSFSPNCAAFPGAPLTGPDGTACAGDPMAGVGGSIARYIFGEFIAEVPIEDYFRNGHAYATFYASELVPDRNGEAQQVMTGLTSGGSPAPTGALMAWAFGFSAAVDLLEGDARIDGDRIAVFGHSRHGKAALIAGVWDRRIDAVIAHQSGYGGAASSRSTAGEGLGKMLNGPPLTPLGPRLGGGYPHWFAPGLEDYVGQLDAIPVDQHQLLALLAPTPVFLGNGRRDVWSDPNSTYRMARAADPIYELYGVSGLEQEAMTPYLPGAEIAYFLRPGGHGTDKRDVAAIMGFLRAHFDGPDPAVTAASVAAEH